MEPRAPEGLLGSAPDAGSAAGGVPRKSAHPLFRSGSGFRAGLPFQRRAFRAVWM